MNDNLANIIRKLIALEKRGIIGILRQQDMKITLD